MLRERQKRWRRRFKQRFVTKLLGIDSKSMIHLPLPFVVDVSRCRAEKNFRYELTIAFSTSLWVSTVLDVTKGNGVSSIDVSSSAYTPFVAFVGEKRENEYPNAINWEWSENGAATNCTLTALVWICLASRERKKRRRVIGQASSLDWKQHEEVVGQHRKYEIGVARMTKEEKIRHSQRWWISGNVGRRAGNVNHDQIWRRGMEKNEAIN